MTNSPLSTFIITGAFEIIKNYFHQQNYANFEELWN